MKKLLKFLCGRIFITGLLLLLQAVWLGVFFWKLAAYSVWLNAAFTLLSLLIVLHILYHDDVSGFKIGWIILILQLPVMGGLLYLLFGGKLPAPNVDTLKPLAALVLVYLLRKVVPLPLAGTLIGTAVGLSGGSIAGVWILARKMDDTIPAEGVEVPDAETAELPENTAQERTPDTDPADERRDDTNG